MTSCTTTATAWPAPWRSCRCLSWASTRRTRCAAPRGRGRGPQRCPAGRRAHALLPAFSPRPPPSPLPPADPAPTQGPLEQVYRAALALGTANQLTNILRDVGEDASQHNRIYVPLDELAAFKIREDEVRGGRRLR